MLDDGTGRRGVSLRGGGVGGGVGGWGAGGGGGMGTSWSIKTATNAVSKPLAAIFTSYVPYIISVNEKAPFEPVRMILFD